MSIHKTLACQRFRSITDVIIVAGGSYIKYTCNQTITAFAFCVCSGSPGCNRINEKGHFFFTFALLVEIGGRLDSQDRMSQRYSASGLSRWLFKIIATVRWVRVVYPKPSQSQSITVKMQRPSGTLGNLWPLWIWPSHSIILHLYTIFFFIYQFFCL